MLLEQVSPTLLSMPLIICHRILEKLEPDDRLIIRKVCRILKTSVDNFGLHYNSIFVKICESTVSMYLLDDICVYYYDLDDVNLSVTYKGKETIIQGENFLKIAFEDLKIVTNETSSLVLHSYDRSGIFAFFISEQGCINVKSIKLNDFSFKEVLIILPMLNAQKLENIEIEYLYDIDNFKQITCLDQWRNAKIIHFYQNSPGIPIEDLFHIEEFTIYLQNLSVQNAIKIQDILMESSTFQKCTLYLRNDDPIELAKVFLPKYLGGNEHSIKYLTRFTIHCELLHRVSHFDRSQWKFSISNE